MRWLRRLIYLAAALAVLLALGVLYVDGHLPAPVPTDAPPYALADLGDALRAVDARGLVDLAELKRRHARLEAFVAALAATSPETAPERFEAVEDRIAYWLNAYHALVLLELLDARSAAPTPSHAFLRTVPIGGERLTRAALLRRALAPVGDARLFLALFTGARGSGVLDGAPFDGDTLDPQLDDAVRRFVRRKENVALDGQVVRLSALFRQHHDAFLAALPPERKHVLQIAWAYLPDACEDGAPGCLTRSDLDRACGTRFDACTVTYVEPDARLAIKH